MTQTIELDLLDLRFQPCPRMRAKFASVGSLGIYKFPRGTYVVTNSAWMPGDPNVEEVVIETTDPELARMPRVMPARFAWSSRAARVGTKHPSGFYYVMSPDNPGDVSGGYIDDAIDAETGHCTPALVDTWIDRSPLWMVHRGTGKPLERRDLGWWFEYRLGRGHDSIQQLPMMSRGYDSQDPSLNSWWAPDEYHFIRTFGYARKAAKAGDLIGRAHLANCSADVRASWILREIPQTSEWIPRSLARKKRDAQRKPGQGIDIARGVAWSLLAVVADADCMGPGDETDKREAELWVSNMIEYISCGMLRNGGFCMHAHGYGMDEDEPWDMYDMDVRKFEEPSWQRPFLIYTLGEAARVFPQFERRVRSILLRAVQPWKTVTEYVPDMYGGHPGLPLYLEVGMAGSIAPIVFDFVTTGVGPARSMYDIHAFKTFERYGIDYKKK